MFNYSETNKDVKSMLNFEIIKSHNNFWKIINITAAVITKLVGEKAEGLEIASIETISSRECSKRTRTETENTDSSQGNH